MTRLSPVHPIPAFGHIGFFIDFKGHIDDTTVQVFLDDIRAHSAELKILGSYPRALL